MKDQSKQESQRREALAQDLAKLEALLADIEQSLKGEQLLSQEIVDRIRELREMCGKERGSISAQSSDSAPS
jgi:hypothetical protein